MTVTATKPVMELRRFQTGATYSLVEKTEMGKHNRDRMTGEVCQVIRLKKSLQ